MANHDDALSFISHLKANFKKLYLSRQEASEIINICQSLNREVIFDISSRLASQGNYITYSKIVRELLGALSSKKAIETKATIESMPDCDKCLGDGLVMVESTGTYAPLGISGTKWAFACDCQRGAMHTSKFARWSFLWENAAKIVKNIDAAAPKTVALSNAAVSVDDDVSFVTGNNGDVQGDIVQAHNP